MEILSHITFNRKFFQSIDNVLELFEYKFRNIIDFSENKTLIKLLYFKKNKNQKIIKRLDAEIYNNFIKIYKIVIEDFEFID